MAYLDLSWRMFRPDEGFYSSEVHTPRPLPVRTFLPTGYEPNYAYPLLVFLHGRGGNERQVLRLAPRLSRRNYVCIGIRGPIETGPRPSGRMGFSWGAPGQHDTLIEDYVFQAVEHTRLKYHIHSERIFLAGICEGATTAYCLGLSFPERFGGVISLNGAIPRRGGPLLRLPEVRQLKVMIGHGIANSLTPLTMAQADHSLLYTAGLDVRMHTYPATHKLHQDMLRDVNRFLMDAISEFQPDEDAEEE
jgi:phospholipase/carboxylesterase